MKKSSAKVKSFEGVLERMPSRLNWTIVHIPFDVAKEWGKRTQINVKGEMNGFAFHTSLFPTGKGGHFILINKKMQKGGRAVAGNKAHFTLEQDTVKREIKAPAELMEVLKESKRLLKFYESLNPSYRNYIAKWVGEGKHSETRRRRADQIAVRLMETVEAEQELPPLIQAAIARNPRAQAGWKLMSKAHRRAHLMGIFYYRDPESRARRIAKAVEEMVEYTERKKRGSTAEGIEGAEVDS